MTTALLVADGLSVGTDTSPYLERFNERMSWNGEPIPDDDLDRPARARSPISRTSCPTAPATSRSSPPRRCEWFADIAVDVAVIEVGLGGPWDATNVVDGRVAVVTNVSSTTSSTSARRRGDIAGREGRDREAGRRRWCWARPTPSWCRSSLARDPGTVVRTRRRLRRARQPARGRRARARPVHAVGARTTTCSSRCTARTRPTTPRSRSPPPRRSSVARSIADRGRRRVRVGAARRDGSRSSGTIRSSCSTARRTSPARTRCARRSTRSSRRRWAARARWVVGILRQKDAARDARCARCARRRPRDRVLPARDPARGDPQRGRRRRARARRRAGRTIEVDRRRRRRGDGARSTRAPPTARSSWPGRCTSRVRPQRALVARSCCGAPSLTLEPDP